EAHTFTVGEQAEQIGASFGIAGYDPLVDSDGTEIVRRADEALYRAKNAGRNCIATAQPAGLEGNWEG
ncbi:MAG TPA: diguanylate cyclase, partial [Anaerolineae bacterium]|nr:diguanylate cyclase [Anaerolineae bacterium]